MVRAEPKMSAVSASFPNRMTLPGAAKLRCIWRVLRCCGEAVCCTCARLRAASTVADAIQVLPFLHSTFQCATQNHALDSHLLIELAHVPHVRGAYMRARSGYGSQREF